MGLLLLFCIWDLGYATMNDSLLSFMTTQRRTLDPGHRDTHLSIRLGRHHDLTRLGAGSFAFSWFSLGWAAGRTVAGRNRLIYLPRQTAAAVLRHGPSVFLATLSMVSLPDIAIY
jgi:hypothetical protein